MEIELKSHKDLVDRLRRDIYANNQRRKTETDSNVVTVIHQETDKLRNALEKVLAHPDEATWYLCYSCGNLFTRDEVLEMISDEGQRDLDRLYEDMGRPFILAITCEDCGGMGD